MNTLDLVKAIAQAAHDKKASRLIVQDLRQRSDICDYQIVCSATNERQTQAICSSIEEGVRKKLNLRPSAIEGKQTGHWILVDYSSVIIHIFLDEIRGYYALEELWPDAKSISIEAKG